jgi:hypothetical protein
MDADMRIFAGLCALRVKLGMPLLDAVIVTLCNYDQNATLVEALEPQYVEQGYDAGSAFLTALFYTMRTVEQTPNLDGGGGMRLTVVNIDDPVAQLLAMYATLKTVTQFGDLKDFTPPPPSNAN